VDCTSILGSPTGLPALRTAALIVMVPVGSPGTSAKPTLLPFGTAVAEHAESGITAVAALIHGVGAWGQLDLAISAVAVPADRQPTSSTSAAIAFSTMTVTPEAHRSRYKQPPSGYNH
jgi:hypothetical protein